LEDHVERRPDDDEIDADEDDMSGMPKGEPELTPLGVDTDPEEDPPDEPSLPGFPEEGEPDVSG
jgi:hypothetical protein